MDPVTTEKCYRVCADAKVALFCAFQRRVDPNFQAIPGHIQNGKIGQILPRFNKSTNPIIGQLELLSAHWFMKFTIL